MVPSILMLYQRTCALELLRLRACWVRIIDLSSLHRMVRACASYVRHSMSHVVHHGVSLLLWKMRSLMTRVICSVFRTWKAVASRMVAMDMEVEVAHSKGEEIYM
jgi:hypothetical protein